jgi:formylglycine-generating enzyme required for sulfatase activity
MKRQEFGSWRALSIGCHRKSLMECNPSALRTSVPSNLQPAFSGIARAQALAAIAFAVVASASDLHGATAADQSKLDARIAELKTKTAAVVATGRARLDTLSAQQRLLAPAAIWRVRGGLTEFKDCANCPQMIVIPAGEFTMGSPASEQHRGAEAQHRVTIAYPFAVSKFEITFDEWDACVKDGGCGGYRPDDQGWGRGKRPVMNISWENAKTYVAWLGQKTGKPYRLLSESEWEYAARAGTATPFSYGSSLSPSRANYNGSVEGSSVSNTNRQKTVPVGSFAANGFGLHDMHGNVSEWVEDCWQDQYNEKTPTDGSPSLEGDCNGRVVRGGSWEDYEGDLRSAARTGGAKNDQFYTDGLRIARDL